MKGTILGTVPQRPKDREDGPIEVVKWSDGYASIDNLPFDGMITKSQAKKIGTLLLTWASPKDLASGKVGGKEK